MPKNIEKFEIIIKLQGFNCNGYPECRIFFNDQLIKNCQIIDTMQVKFEVKLEKTNILIIEQHGKKFGEGGVYDTILDKNNKIIADKYIIIQQIKIDNIDMCDWWHFGQLENDYIFEHQKEIGLYKNVKYTLVFNSPFYNWLIDKKNSGYKEVGPSWKKSSLNSFSDGYSITQEKFDSLIDTAKNKLDNIN